MVIREIGKEDLEMYRESIKDYLYENLCINLPDLAGKKELAEEKYWDIVKFTEDGSAILYGAFFEGQLSGFLWAYEREVLGEKRMHLEHLIVDSEKRTHGIGTALLEQLKNEALERGVHKIELMTTMTNETAIHFYEKNDYNMIRTLMELELEERND